MIAALLFAFNLLNLWRDTNSHAANARGVKAYNAKKYADAAKAFSKEKPSADAMFNQGTAEVADGEREAGAQILSKVTSDAKLKGDAFYNRGFSALGAKAYDYAIHDFSEALKVNPADARAKRNLEIALAKKAQQQKSSSNKNRQGPGPAPQPQPQNTQQREKSDPNSEALLRSVQEQEQEELSRMHRSKADRSRVGW